VVDNGWFPATEQGVRPGSAGHATSFERLAARK